MERVYTINDTVVGNDGILTFIRDNISELGWTVVDDRISASNYVVVYSDGHETNRLPCYVKFRHNNGTYFQVDIWMYWDSSAHTGINCFNRSSSNNDDNCGTYCDAATNNSVKIMGNKDFIYGEVFRSSNSETAGFIVSRITDPTWDFLGEFQATVSGGLNVVAQLNTGQASSFRVGPEYRLCSPAGHIDKITLNDINSVTDQVTIDSLYYTVSSGTLIGSVPFPWYSVGVISSSYDAFGLKYTINTVYDTDQVDNSYQIGKTVGIAGTSQDWHYHNEVILRPYLYYDGGSIGSCSYVQYLDYGSQGDNIGVNEIDTGSAHSSSTTSQIVDNNKSWVASSLSGTAVIMTSGDKEELIRYITDNTSTTITVDPVFNTAVSGGDTYAICEAIYTCTDYAKSNLCVKAV
jgi:hypothetical protein